MTTIATDLTWKAYVALEGQTVFAYNFLVLASSDLEVYVNEDLRTDYTVTGVGLPGGGTIVFLSPVLIHAGDQVFVRRNTPETQLTDFVDHDAFLADTLEDALGKLTLLLQEIREDLERRPALAVPVLTTLRNLFFPTPVPLKLWGWDALGTGITYYDPAIVQVTPGLTAHIAYGETQVTVPTVPGAVQLVSGTVFPAGCLALGALVRVTTTFGNTNSLSTFMAGSLTIEDCWGTGLARTATAAPTAANNAGMFTSYALRPIVAGEVVTLTAQTGTFDATGVARITGTFLVLTSA